jgi:hypothetical protein
MPDHAANTVSQSAALEVLRESLPGFYVPTKTEKKKLLELMGISKRFAQTFDVIRLRVEGFEQIQSAKDFDLLEMKATNKCLPAMPQGFFFGMTENEEMLLKVFEDKYFLCLVCVHPKSRGFKLVGWDELKSLSQNKRVQYQINLKSKVASAISE